MSLGAQLISERRAQTQDESLSEFATRNADSAGRMKSIPPDPFRTPYERDADRILHSMPFRRLRHKTQVFPAPVNDHICTRMEHVLHVASVADTLAKCLRLNADLTRAMALGHDLGHPPFGHAGERALRDLCAEAGLAGFSHEAHSLRVVDRVAERGEGLNLTWEVRDGILCHCGESGEAAIRPDRSRRGGDLSSMPPRTSAPATLEGACVRMADRVAYLGRDMEDAILARLIKREDVPVGLRQDLGDTNGAIIGALVADIVQASEGRDEIRMSDRVARSAEEMRAFNTERIYRHPEVAKREKLAGEMLRRLFEAVLPSVEDALHNPDRRPDRAREPMAYRVSRYVWGVSYPPDTPPALIAADYLAGMTDGFARQLYEQCFLPTALA